MRQSIASLLPLLALAACHRHPRDSQPPATVPAAVVEVREVEDARSPSDDLLPGNLNAFGLPMPTVTQERLAVDDMKIFRVDAPMPRVMRYLEQRLEVHDADIHPLAAVIHRAIVRGVQSNLIVDVGVRDEGDRTMVTVWNRTPPPSANAAPTTPEQGLRAVGVDPATGQYAPEFNR
jgi:hypothetical protein